MTVRTFPSLLPADDGEGEKSERAHNWQLCNIIIPTLLIWVAPISTQSPPYTLSLSHSVIIVGSSVRRSCAVPLFGLLPIDYGRRTDEGGI